MRQVSEHFEVSIATVKQWVRAGLFPHSELEETPRGPVRMIPMSDVRAFKRPVMGRPVEDPKKPSKKKR